VNRLRRITRGWFCLTDGEALVAKVNRRRSAKREARRVPTLAMKMAKPWPVLASVLNRQLDLAAGHCECVDGCIYIFHIVIVVRMIFIEASGEICHCRCIKSITRQGNLPFQCLCLF